ncbi:hypothetical protein ACH492_27795 [Streptomyces sp. NPDC019443]|uniref:hypothetical protein n=1 Tax=Streptomyces sp. NPDC019443 TaxID=3365061 RepID=UPI0037AF25F0
MAGAGQRGAPSSALAWQQRIGGTIAPEKQAARQVRFDVDGGTVTGGREGERWHAVHEVPVDVDTSDMSEEDAEQIASRNAVQELRCRVSAVAGQPLCEELAAPLAGFGIPLLRTGNAGCR